ncbi:hypothetical protein [Variovorax sp. CF313]|uniref:hypothetical protein n=1 Tax=Variovorax sp. CF313 TaxID=1144315 RepID=UPI0012FC429C|nr:hypothetical protein [Variovorax sp. CF313]
MKINLGVAAQTPQFSKKMRRIRPAFELLFDDFSNIKLTNPIYDSILIGVTDSQSVDYFEEIKNREGYFQILAGMSGDFSDEKAKELIFEIVKKSIQACPFSRPDKELLMRFLDEWKLKLFNT